MGHRPHRARRRHSPHAHLGHRCLLTAAITLHLLHSRGLGRLHWDRCHLLCTAQGHSLLAHLQSHMGQGSGHSRRQGRGMGAAAMQVHLSAPLTATQWGTEAQGALGKSLTLRGWSAMCPQVSRQSERFCMRWLQALHQRWAKCSTQLWPQNIVLLNAVWTHADPHSWPTAMPCWLSGRDEMLVLTVHWTALGGSPSQDMPGGFRAGTK